MVSLQAAIFQIMIGVIHNYMPIGAAITEGVDTDTADPVHRPRSEFFGYLAKSISLNIFRGEVEIL